MIAYCCAMFLSQMYADGNFSQNDTTLLKFYSLFFGQKGQVAKPELAAKRCCGVCMYFVWLLGQAKSWKEEKGNVQKVQCTPVRREYVFQKKSRKIKMGFSNLNILKSWSLSFSINSKACLVVVKVSNESVGQNKQLVSWLGT